jgi:hypothetical protein
MHKFKIGDLVKIKIESCVRHDGTYGIVLKISHGSSEYCDELLVYSFNFSEFLHQIPSSIEII